MIQNNAASGAGALLSEIQSQLESASGPAMAFTLVMQKQAIEDRIRFKAWLDGNMAANAEIDQSNARAAASVRLSRRAQHMINSF